MEKTRYTEKLQMIGGIDPYSPTLKEDLKTLGLSLTDDKDALPPVTYIDIVNYLIESKSAFTMEELKAYKSLEAYNQFVCGWVKDVHSVAITGTAGDRDNFLILAKVKHSQRMNEPPLKPWIIAEKTGRIIAGHCDCMAGLAESCSHIGALLFYIDAAVRLKSAKTVTDEKAYWLLPSSIQKVPYAEVRNINFTSAKSLKKKLDTAINAQVSPTNSGGPQRPEPQPSPSSGGQQLPEPQPSPSSKGQQLPEPQPSPSSKGQQLPEPQPSPSSRGQQPSPSTSRYPTRLPDVPVASKDELETFKRHLYETNTKPVVLAVMPGYADYFVPSILSENLPMPLSELRDEACFNMEKDELDKHCELVFSKLEVTKEQVENAEARTRKQAGSKEWHGLRIGRITASRMKAVCCTTLAKPAMSTLNSICYPVSFSSEATRWGCDHEKDALAEYSARMELSHENFKTFNCGLVISTEYPHMGASPDALVTCDCCGDGTVEVKCPFCIRGQKVASNLPFLDAEGKLKANHQYYYQVQTQIILCDRVYGDFVVWTEKDLKVERIRPERPFWDKASASARLFFLHVILPELVGKYYSQRCPPKQVSDTTSSKHPQPSDKSAVLQESQHTAAAVASPADGGVVNTAQEDEELICICQVPYDRYYDKVIGCDNENCKYKWLHYSCVNIKRAPKGAYFCPECKPQFKKKRVQKKK